MSGFNYAEKPLLSSVSTSIEMNLRECNFNGLAEAACRLRAANFLDAARPTPDTSYAANASLTAFGFL